MQSASLVHLFTFLLQVSFYNISFICSEKEKKSHLCIISLFFSYLIPRNFNHLFLFSYTVLIWITFQLLSCNCLHFSPHIAVYPMKSLIYLTSSLFNQFLLHDSPINIYLLFTFPTVHTFLLSMTASTSSLPIKSTNQISKASSTCFPSLFSLRPPLRFCGGGSFACISKRGTRKQPLAAPASEYKGKHIVPEAYFKGGLFVLAFGELLSRGMLCSVVEMVRIVVF